MASPLYHHLYCTAAWRRVRAGQLRRSPFCRMHEALGRTVVGTVVDHVRPHEGNLELFLAEDNLQTLCKPCHDSHKQAQEHNANGLLRGVGHNGRPLDLAHPWHRAPQGGDQNPRPGWPQTGPLPSFAKPRNHEGGAV